MRRLLPLSAIFLFTACAVTRSLSADDNDRVMCFSLGNENYKDSSKFDPGMDACTRMINSGRYNENALASIHRARESWKQKKGELDASLADYSTSIRIEPDNVESYNYRADLYQQRGDLDSARAEYDHTTRIGPAYAAAYFTPRTDIRKIKRH